jgi:hypothetical protein
MLGPGVAAAGQRAAEPAALYEGYTGRGSSVMGTRLDTNVIAIITHTNGTVTALQFTQISGTNATYRWRSRSGAADTVLEGQSGFSEPFHPSSPPPGVLVTIFPGATDLLTFRAGGLRVV